MLLCIAVILGFGVIIQADNAYHLGVYDTANSTDGTTTLSINNSTLQPNATNTSSQNTASSGKHSTKMTTDIQTTTNVNKESSSVDKVSSQVQPTVVTSSLPSTTATSSQTKPEVTSVSTPSGETSQHISTTVTSPYISTSMSSPQIPTTVTSPQITTTMTSPQTTIPVTSPQISTETTTTQISTETLSTKSTDHVATSLTSTKEETSATQAYSSITFSTVFYDTTIGSNDGTTTYVMTSNSYDNTTDGQQSKNRKLSGGQVAGIIIGVLVLFTFTVIVLLLLFARQHRLYMKQAAKNFVHFSRREDKASIIHNPVYDEESNMTETSSLSNPNLKPQLERTNFFRQYQPTLLY